MVRPVSEEELHAFVDGTLDSRRKEELEAYLADHPEVAARVASYQHQRQVLKAAYGAVAEEPVPSQLNLARILERRRQPEAARWWKAAAAAVVLLCVGGASGWSLRGATQSAGGIAALAEEARASYAVYAPDHVRPVEVRATERDGLADWAAQRLGQAVPVPDLSQSGFRLMGGRVVATLHGPAMMFMYDDDQGTRLVMLVRRMAVEQDRPMAPRATGGLTGYTWSDHGLGLSLVGPASAERLHPLADEARRQVLRGI